MILALTSVFVGLVLIVLAGMTLSFSLSGIREKEYRAAVFGFLLLGFLMIGLILHLLLWAAGFFETSAGTILLAGITVISIISGWVLLGRIGGNANAAKGTAGHIVGEVERFDERETVFDRDSLAPGTAEYKKFYDTHPEWKNRDAQRRAKGGPLGDVGAIDRPYGEFNVAATIAAGLIPGYVAQPHIIHPLDFIGKKQNVCPEEATCRVKGFARSLGADLVGITRLNPLWTYSHRGMGGRQVGEDWGRRLEPTHEFVIVIATEMAFDLVRCAPHSATTIESARNYADGAIISTSLAQYIANLGYSATAEHFAHYQSLMVPLAVDAGLGELGRHGYLVTKELGSRLRLAAVTTNMALVTDQPIDIGVADFCSLCKKCADCCPSGSIPKDGPKEVNGTLRWKMNAESCHDYWGRIGTDCNICMRVCPWSHDKTFPHRVVRWAVSRNKYSRRLFLFMDDLFYGRKPKSKPAPNWASYGPVEPFHKKTS